MLCLDSGWCSAGAALCQHRREDLCGHKDRHIPRKREEELLAVSGLRVSVNTGI